jgi:hypothetical protein
MDETTQMLVDLPLGKEGAQCFQIRSLGYPGGNLYVIDADGRFYWAEPLDWHSSIRMHGKDGREFIAWIEDGDCLWIDEIDPSVHSHFRRRVWTMPEEEEDAPTRYDEQRESPSLT